MIGSSRMGWVFLVFCLIGQGALGQEIDTLSVSAGDVKRSPIRWNGEYKMDLGGGAWNERKDDVATAYFYFHTKFDANFSRYLKIHLAPQARLFSGRSQERLDDDDLNTRIFLNDFYASFEPIKELKLKVGGHSQSIVGNSILVSNWATFPGLQEIADIEVVKNSHLKFIFQQVVPTSHSLNTERIEKEPLPLFTTSQVRLESKLNHAIDLKGQFGLYNWSKMPLKVVSESRLDGNVGVGEIESGRFLYEHRGWFAGFSGCACPDVFPVGVKFDFSRIHNTAAPSNRADAQLLGAGPVFKFKNIELELLYRTVFIESEATVASYNKGRYGHTNRIGDRFDANLKFSDLGFSLYTEIYRLKPINKDEGFQGDLNEVFFGVETDYVSF